MDLYRKCRLTVKVALVAEACLWCWEIGNTENGTLLESSWANEWMGYESSRDALWVGIMRLTELTRLSRGTLLPGRRASPADQNISSAQ